MAKKILTTLQKLAIAAAGFLLAFGVVTPITAHAARTDALWDYIQSGNYTKPNGSANGTDILIFGSNHYLNFGAVTGTNGYGIRDNAGTIECKSSGGAWASCTGGGGGVTSVTGTYPIVSSGGTTPALSLAFGTTTANIWQLTQTNTVAPIFSSLTGVLKGNGSSALTVAVNGTDYSLITALTCSAGNHFSGVTAAGVFTCTADTGSGGSGLATSSPTSNDGILVYNSAGAGSAYSVASTSVTGNNGLTGSFTVLNTGGKTNSIGLATINAGVLGAVTNGSVPTSLATSTLYGVGTGGQLLGWTNGVLGFIATTTAGTGLTYNAGSPGNFSVNTTQNITRLSNLATDALVLTGSANGTLGAYTGTSCTNQFVRSLSALAVATCATVGAADVSLANLSATDSTLTFSGTYNGSTARTIGLNLGNANSWTALQQFANASSTLESVTKTAYFGAIATTTINADTMGSIVLNTGTITISTTTATSTLSHISATQVAIGSLSGILKATSGYISTALVSLTADVTGILPVANGGTNASSFANTNGVDYFDGTRLVNNSLFKFDGTNLGIGTSTPGSLFSIGGNGTGWNFFDNATSTKSGVGGINIASGCYAVNGVCLSTGGGTPVIDQQIYTATSSSPFTWTKVANAKMVYVQCWGGGGSGSARVSGASNWGNGGGGGAYKEKWLLASTLGSTETVTLGVGGASVAANAAGINGGNSTFGAWLTAYGGAGGGISTGQGGIGGGGDAVGGIGSGAGGGNTAGANGVYWGGAGGGGSGTAGGVGGNAWWGGAGGGGDANGLGVAGGTSVEGGAGGPSTNTNGTAQVTLKGTQPGGGGGANQASTNNFGSGPGGDGKCIVTTI